MTVRELIALLMEMPQDAKVQILREGYAICDEELDPCEPELDKNGIVQI